MYSSGVKDAGLLRYFGSIVLLPQATSAAQQDTVCLALALHIGYHPLVTSKVPAIRSSASAVVSRWTCLPILAIQAASCKPMRLLQSLRTRATPSIMSSRSIFFFFETPGSHVPSFPTCQTQTVRPSICPSAETEGGRLAVHGW